jgi:tetratricopeptide (TPR) repeat protein
MSAERESLKIIRLSINLSDSIDDHAPDKDVLIKNLVNERYKGEGQILDLTIKNSTVNLVWGIKKSPFQVEEMLKQARFKIRQRTDIKGAIDILYNALKINGIDPDLHYTMALAYLEQKDYANGLDKCMDTLKICPVFKSAYFLIGNLYSNMRKFELAEKYLKSGLRLDPNNVSALINLGAVFSIKKEYSNAINKFEKAISLSPKESKAYFGLGKVYLYQKDYENSNRCFKAVIKLDPSSKIAQIAKRSLKIESEHNPQVQESADSEDVNSQEIYSQAYQSVIHGDFKTAQDAYKRYLQSNPQDSDVWASLASCQLRMGLVKEAVTSIEKAIRFQPNNSLFYKQAAIIYDADHNSPKVILLARKAIELGKKDSVTLTLLGKHISKSSVTQESIGYFKQAIKINPNNINARYHYAQALKKMGNTEEAKQNLEEILWIKSDSPLKEKARQEIERL